MTKIIFAFFCSCNQKGLMDESNISEYEDFIKYFSLDNDVDVISRNPENPDLIVAWNLSGEKNEADKAYIPVFQNNKPLDRIFKNKICLDGFEENSESATLD